MPLDHNHRNIHQATCDNATHRSRVGDHPAAALAARSSRRSPTNGSRIDLGMNTAVESNQDSIGAWRVTMRRAAGASIAIAAEATTSRGDPASLTLAPPTVRIGDPSTPSPNTIGPDPGPTRTPPEQSFRLAYSVAAVTAFKLREPTPTLPCTTAFRSAPGSSRVRSISSAN